MLSQVVSIQAEALLPSTGAAPGGPTASLVLTLQGDRLDPTTAEGPANYTVLWLGPNGAQVIPLAAARAPSTLPAPTWTSPAALPIRSPFVRP